MSELQKKDGLYIWHPYTQMHGALPPIPIIGGKDAYLFDENGGCYIDAISSWWTTIHGHSNTYIADKVCEQLKTLEHVIFAGCTHAPAIHLAERLLQLLPPNQRKVFFSDNGSTAVEVAIKMALQYWHNKGVKKTKILALQNAYHGDTFGAMSVSGRGLFTKPFNDLLFEVIFLPTPTDDEERLAVISNTIRQYSTETAAFIFEPLVQGAAGMVMYEASALDKVMKICKTHGIITIADEVMTGFGRTGKFFACDYLSENPDIICISKGLTGGTMAMGITSCTDAIYNEFLSADKTKALFHGHSYTANPVACAASLASLDLMTKDETWNNINRINNHHTGQSKKFNKLKGVKRCAVTGTILVVEIATQNEDSYLNDIRDNLYNFFLENNVLLRPLGNVLYILPPYCISDKDLFTVYNLIEIAIEKFAAK